VALAECCFDTGGMGADVEIARAASDGHVDVLAATLFGESASRVIVSTHTEQIVSVLEAANAAGVPAHRIGRTGGSSVRIAVDGVVAIECAVPEAEARWSACLSNWLDGRAA
jgi:phosphoribosylformylglycinamidine synthase